MQLIDISMGESRSEPLDKLASTLYGALRRLANQVLGDRARRGSGGMEATELVHECYLRLASNESVSEAIASMERTEFLAFASRMLRNILVDHARRERAVKRGQGWRKITMSEVSELTDGDPEIDLVLLDEALERLERVDARQARIVELRFFGGLTGDEVSKVLGVSRRTITQEWGMARAWLRRELTKR